MEFQSIVYCLFFKARELNTWTPQSPIINPNDTPTHNEMFFNILLGKHKIPVLTVHFIHLMSPRVTPLMSTLKGPTS